MVRCLLSWIFYDFLGTSEVDILYLVGYFDQESTGWSFLDKVSVFQDFEETRCLQERWKFLPTNNSLFALQRIRNQPEPTRTSPSPPKNKKNRWPTSAKAPVHMRIRHRSCLLSSEVVQNHHRFPLHEVCVGQGVAVLAFFAVWGVQSLYSYHPSGYPLVN